jgi:hypothetical protein
MNIKHAIPLTLMVFMALGVHSVAAQPAFPKTVKKPLNAVSPKHIEQHIAYLADDRMRGRLPGTPEFELAVQYVEEQYRRIGLNAAGEDGTYRQQVTIRDARLEVEASSLAVIRRGIETLLEPGTDYSLAPDMHAAQNAISAPVVFAGYGISAPQLGYDDYAGLDVKGKIVIVLSRALEERFGSTETAHLGRLSTKLAAAHAHGAVGLLTLPAPSVGNRPAAGTRPMQEAKGVIFPDGTIGGGAVNPYSALQVVGSLTWDGLGKLLGQSNKSARELAAMVYNPPAPLQMDAVIQARTQTSYKDISSFNVIGKIEGADPLLKDEYVVHTAHLDHVGVGRPINGDSIYNGAHDNASGVAALLEIARAYKSLKKAPRRSVLIVMVTGEEMGLLGSAYFAKQPTVPRERIVANVNTDMPTLLAPLLGVVPLGAEHSTIMKHVRKAAAHLGIEVMQDHMPEQVRFVRSDQYSFVLEGIPALHIKYGLKTQDPSFNLDKLIQDFTQNHYHKPSDELNDSFDFEAGKTYVQLNFLISYSIADDPERPVWNADSIFRNPGAIE